jgi:hypothetical protein
MGLDSRLQFTASGGGVDETDRREYDSANCCMLLALRILGSA